MGRLFDLLGSDTFLMLANILLALFLFVAAALFVKCMAMHESPGMFAGIKNAIEKRGKERTDREELIRKTEGAQEKDSFMYKADLIINQSGIRGKIKFFNAECLILLCSLIAIASTLASGMIMGNALSIPIGIMSAAIPVAALILKANANYRKTEGQIVHFLNMVENYTKTEDNIITILGKVYPYLQEPLCSAVKECYAEAKNTGDMSLAFRRLDAKIGHEKFSEILRNLELCSRYEANYQMVVAASRDIMINYIKSKKKIKNIANDAAIDLVIMLAAMFIMFGVIDSFVEGSLINILLSGAIGMLILMYMAAAIVYSVLSVLSIVRR